MPRYLRGNGKIQRNRAFHSIDHISHFLTKANDDEWLHFQNVATQMLQGKIIPKRKLKKKSIHSIATKKAYHLLPELHHEVQRHYDQEDLGGGIIEAINTVGHEVSHLLGIDKLQELLGFGPKTKPSTLQSEIVAYLTDETYKKPSERRDVTVGYTRIQKYDSDLFSVWEKNCNGEKLVCVRGTKMNFSDIGKDLQIMAGQTVKSNELDALLNQIEKDFPDEKYDIASHSLGSAYVYSELADHREHMDDIMMYLPASSPFQNTEMLNEFANNENIMYFMNHGDVVSHAVYQQFSNDTLENNVTLGRYRYDPLSAHNLGQFYGENMHETIATEPYVKTYDNEDTSFETAEFAQDSKETQEAGLS